jgi:cytidine deaminase
MAAPRSARKPISDLRWRALAREAEKARARAHAPYSGYRVGAALLTDQGVVHGCNVENASYPLCICAEAAVVARAVSQGCTGWKAITVATQGPVPGAPCGACRQILAEFGKDLPVGLVVDGVVVRTITVAELLPLAFDAEVLATSTSTRPRARKTHGTKATP